VNNSFKKNHPILFNAILMVLAFFAACYIFLLLADVFTNHGQEKKVPDVRFMTLEQAASKLEAAGFKWEISDSIYNDQYKPGTVIDQTPKAKSYVKAMRIIYLSINAMNPRTVSLPVLTEISIRQGVAILQSLGFKNVLIDTVASPYEGLILSATVNGRNLAPGTKVTLNARIKLTMGDGSITDLDPDAVIDPNTRDSLDENLNNDNNE
jgi:beta-lactam-binding protein with PASTA domain